MQEIDDNSKLKEMAGRQIMGLLDENLGSILVGFQKFGVAMVDIAGLIFTVTHLLDTEAVALGEVDRAFLKVAIVTDGFVDTAEEALLTMKFINQETFSIDGAMRRWVDTLDLSEAELRRLVDAGDESFTMFGLNTDEANELRAMLEDKLNAAVEKSAGKLEDDLKRALFGVRGEADKTTTAIGKTADEILALVDPVFAAVNATRAADEAQAAYIVALAESQPGSAESIQAAQDLELAHLREKAALDFLKNDALPGAQEEFQNLARDVGIVTEDIEGLNDLVAGGFPSLFTPQGLIDMKLAKEDLEDILAAARGLANLGPISPVVGRNIRPRLHQGGIVPGPAGANVPIIAQAGEMVIPAAQVSAGVSVGGGGAATGSQPIVVQLMLDGQILAETIVTADELNRRRGLN